MSKFLFIAIIACLWGVKNASAHDAQSGRATAILNEGVIVEAGDRKILFDPIYDNGFQAFPEMSDDLKTSIINGAPPYDSVVAIFVSHYHGDHFSTSNMLRLLTAQSEVLLYAPSQAIDALMADENWTPELENRVMSVALETGSAPATFTLGDIKIEAVRTPHAGWPNNHAEVENITFRVTLTDDVRVMHMGDADADPLHFAPHAAFFSAARTHMGFVPFWFINPKGMMFMEAELNIAHPVGVHVPIDVPESLISAREKLNADFFSELDETRYIGETEKN